MDLVQRVGVRRAMIVTACRREGGKEVCKACQERYGISCAACNTPPYTTAVPGSSYSSASALVPAACVTFLPSLPSCLLLGSQCARPSPCLTVRHLPQELTFTWPRLPQYWGERQLLSARMQQVSVRVCDCAWVFECLSGGHGLRRNGMA